MENWQDTSELRRARAISHKVLTQIPDRGEEQFMFAIFHQALMDLIAVPAPSMKESKVYSMTRARRSARRYLNSNIPHLEMCGIDSDWVRRLLIEGELL
jgi:hypothetical protein